MHSYPELQNRHAALLNRSEDEGNDLEEVFAFMESVKRSSEYIPLPHERDHLRAILRYWSGHVYDHTLEYPHIELLPAEHPHTEPLPEPHTELLPAEAPKRIAWTPIILASLVALLLLAMLGSLNRNIDSLISAFGPSTTSTPAPPVNENTIFIELEEFEANEGEINNAHSKLRQEIQEAARWSALSQLQLNVQITSEINSDSESSLLDSNDSGLQISGIDRGDQVTISYRILNQNALSNRATEDNTDNRPPKIINPELTTILSTDEFESQSEFFALFAIGQGALAAERYTESTRYIENAVDLLESEIESSVGGIEAIYFQLGWLYGLSENSDDWEKAIDYYNDAIELDETNIAALNNSGRLLERQQDLEAALANFKKVVELAPKYVGAYANQQPTEDNLNSYLETIALDEPQVKLSGPIILPGGSNGLRNEVSSLQVENGCAFVVGSQEIEDEVLRACENVPYFFGKWNDGIKRIGAECTAEEKITIEVWQNVGYDGESWLCEVQCVNESIPNTSVLEPVCDYP